ncbi:MAG: DMT family transporter [Leptospirales bacterium]|nr:DMT family transporter [Leptospirales bacterium]
MQDYMIFFILLGLIAGATVPIQAGINSNLSLFTGSNISAAIISFIVGTIAIIAFALIARTPFPKPDAFTGAPWWVWIGGAFGAFYVVASMILVHRVGAVSMIAFIIAGQMIASIIIDHYGLAGYPINPISIYKIVGIIFIIIGVVFIKFFQV